MPDVRELVSLLNEADSLAIVCHDNPDPDCLASALALRHIATACELNDFDIVYGGNITHQQNRTFVNLLDIELEAFTDFDAEDWGLVAFVDHSEPAANTAFPPGTPVDIVIDHHLSDAPVEATFVDIREDYGATATIFVEYLQQLEIDIPMELASALLFALQRERIDYVRHPTRHEYEAARYLFPMVDTEFIRRIYNSSFSTKTMDAIGKAIGERKTRDGTLVSTIGRTTERDALPQAADFLLNLEGISTVLVFGVTGDTLHVSARSSDPRVSVSAVLEEAFGKIGTVGGHRDMGAGQIPLGIFADNATDDDELIDFLSTRVKRRFFKAMNLGEGERDE